MWMIAPYLLKIIIMVIDLKYFLHKGKYVITVHIS